MDAGPQSTLHRPTAHVLDAVFHQSPVPAVLHGADNRITFVNGAMLALLGRDRPTLLGSDVRDTVLVRRDVVASVSDRLALSMTGELAPVQVRGRLRVRAATGPTAADIAVRVITDRIGRPLGVLLQVLSVDTGRRGRGS